MKYQRIFFTFCELFVFSAINLFARHALIFKADIFRSHYRQERNYDFWLGSLAKFPLSENSDKIRLTELAKNQTFPLFMTSLRLMLALQPPAPNYCWLGIFGAKPSATEKKHKQKKIRNQIMKLRTAQHKDKLLRREGGSEWLLGITRGWNEL